MQDDIKKLIIQQMEVPIPYCICAKVSKAGNMRQAKIGYRNDPVKAM